MPQETVYLVDARMVTKDGGTTGMRFGQQSGGGGLVPDDDPDGVLGPVGSDYAQCPSNETYQDGVSGRLSIPAGARLTEVRDWVVNCTVPAWMDVAPVEVYIHDYEFERVMRLQASEGMTWPFNSNTFFGQVSEIELPFTNGDEIDLLNAGGRFAVFGMDETANVVGPSGIRVFFVSALVTYRLMTGALVTARARFTT